MVEPRVGVVGAGVAGLAAARRLVELGFEAVLFDKGRGPGGRISSRRAAPFAFDHGAQYFTARDERFRPQMDAWLRSGAVARWDGRFVALDRGRTRPVDDAGGRYVGTPRMSSLARHLALELDVRVGSRVASIEHAEARWTISDEHGRQLGRFERLLITAPPAQAAALIGASSPLGARAAALVLRPCWAVMLGLAARYEVPFDGAFCEGSPLSWVARDSSKPGRPRAESWVLHAAPDWSEAQLGEAPARVIERLSGELQALTGVALGRVLHEDAHFWRYALPDPAIELGCLFDEERCLALAGDAYRGGRVEGAWSSGLAAAERLARA